MILLLQKIYSNFFILNNDATIYLQKLSLEIQNKYDSNEINFLKSCIEKNIDIQAIDIFLRNKNSNNIVSFVLLRISSIAECLPITQGLYVNKKNINIVSRFFFLSKTVINFIVLKLKAKYLYKNILKEYPNV